jgi:hypothetical protein
VSNESPYISLSSDSLDQMFGVLEYVEGWGNLNTHLHDDALYMAGPILVSRRASVGWPIARVLQPTRFADSLFGQLHLMVEASALTESRRG